MESVLAKMKSCYDKLTTILSEASVNPQDIDKFLGGMHVSIRSKCDHDMAPNCFPDSYLLVG